MRLPICLYVAGSPPAEVARTHGQFAAWFEPLLSGAPWRAFDATTGRLPRLSDYSAVVITGSPASMTAPEPWMEAAVELVRRAHATATPLLGVCFGHQLIGAAFGAGVVANPTGWEVGTYPVTLSAAGRDDPLFRDLPAEFPVNLVHRDAIDPDTVSPAGGLTVLAANARTPVQAIAAGPVVRGVQFHPEFDGAVTRAYVDARADALTADARARGAEQELPEQLRARVADCPHGAAVIANFVRHWVAEG